MKVVLATPKIAGETQIYRCDDDPFGPDLDEVETAAKITEGLRVEYACVTCDVQSYSV